MSSFGGVVSGVGGLFGDEGKNKRVPLWGALDSDISKERTRYQDLRKSGESSLADWVKAYLADSTTSKERSGQEIANIDRYYSGGVESDLARLRASREAAIRDAAERGTQYALANVSRSRAMGEGGPSSYDRRMGLRSINDIMTQAALDRTGQERTDYDFLERARLGLTGQRQGMADTLTSRLLVPEQMRRSLYGQDLGYLGNLLGLYKGNTAGYKYEPSLSERLGQITSDLGSTVMEGASVVGSLYGMGGMGGMGGGAPTANQTGAMAGGGGPMSYPAANTWTMNNWNAGSPNYFPNLYSGAYPAPGYY